MQSRVQVFRCVAQLSKIKDTDPCARCMSRWIRDGADAFDAAQGIRRVLPVAQVSAPTGQQACEQGQCEIAGMARVAEEAKLRPASTEVLTAELLELGAVSVGELSPEDWRGLRCWATLRPFEQRRLLKAVDVEGCA